MCIRDSYWLALQISTFLYLEYGIDHKNGFAKTFIPNLKDSIKINSIPIKDIRIIQKECVKANDQSRRLVALLSDTGMRLSEACGLLNENINFRFCDIKAESGFNLPLIFTFHGSFCQSSKPRLLYT